MLGQQSQGAQIREHRHAWGTVGMSGHAWHRSVVDAKKADIVAAARTLFLEQGYARATMSALAAAAGVSPTTLYKHFPDKDGLFAAVLETEAALFAAALDSQDMLGDGPLAHKLEAFGVRYALLLAQPETLALVRLIVAEAHGFEALAERFLQAMKGPVFHRLTAIIDQAMITGELAPHPPSDSIGAFLGHIERTVLLTALLSPAHAKDPANDAHVVRLAARSLLLAYGPTTQQHREDAR